MGPGEEQFWYDIFPAELDVINARIDVLNARGDRNRPHLSRSEDRPTMAVGLALSGGGVRSAAFSLGVLQAFNQHGVFDNVHYLSTVSGGGYAGGSMVAAMSVSGGFPFGERATSAAPAAEHIRDTESVSHVRNYSNFLIPFGVRDVLTSIAIVIRGIVANLGWVLPVLLVAAAVTIFFNPEVPDLTQPDLLGQALPWIPFPHFGLSIVGALAGIALFFLWALFRSILPQDERSEFRVPQRPVRSLRHAISGRLPRYAALYLTVLAALAFAEFQSFVLSAMFHAKMNAPDAHGGVLAAVLAGWVQYFAAAAAPFLAVVMFFRRQLADILKDAGGRSGVRSFLAALLTQAAVWIAGAVLPLLLWIVYLHLTYWGIMFEPAARAGAACPAQDISGRVELSLPGQTLSGDLTGTFSVDGAATCPEAADDSAKPTVVEFASLAHAPGPIQKLAGLADFTGRAVPPSGLAYAFIAAILFALSYWLKPNANSLHRLYRDRLSKAFFFDPRQRAPGQEAMTGGRDLFPLDDMKLHEIATINTPYPLINTTLNIHGSDIANRRGRNGDFFLFSPLFTGSNATCYAPTEAMEEAEPDLDFPTAVAVSGAAASSNMGSKSIRALTPTLALLNVRLGFWMKNPHYLVRGSKTPAPASRRVLVYLYNELTGRLYEDTNLVYLTDGGHIENLGVYELLRRKCRLIVVVDGEADRDMRFGAFVTLQRYARIDLGIRIRVPWEAISETTRGWMGAGSSANPGPVERAPSNGPHVAIGQIDYGAGQEGYLVYVKLSLTGDENDYVRDYARRYPQYPHETTGDQFFSEEQFEVYRALGFHAMFGFLQGDADVAVAEAILRSGSPDEQEAAAKDEGRTLVPATHPALAELRGMLGL